jgi:hypothetical protein
MLCVREDPLIAFCVCGRDKKSRKSIFGIAMETISLVKELLCLSSILAGGINKVCEMLMNILEQCS